jgi:hypothetical protein
MIRFLLTLCTLAALASSVVASTVITGTLTITNAANINSTNAYTIDVNGDVRTWTNGVVTPSTDILASTNTATAALRALVHFATYPVSSLVLSGDGTSYLSWRAATDTALAITLNTNTWGVVTYATNTVGVTATTVAVPYTFFGAASQDTISDGLINWLNLAPTNKLSSLQVAWPLSAQAADSAVTNWVADFAGNPYRSITASTNVNFIQSTNRPTAATNVLEAVYFITASGANRTLTLNSSWLPTPSAIAITNGTIGILTVAGRGTAEGDVHWSYSLGGYVRDTDTDTDDQTAAEVVSTPAGTLAANDVQEALDELDTEKEPALTDSASLRGTLSDESGTGPAIFEGGALGAATATTAAANDNDTSVATTAFVQTELTDLIDGGAGWAGVQDFGGASDFEIPNGAAPTVNTFGEIAGDNDLWGAGRGALVHYDGTAATALVAPLVSDTPSNGQVPKWNTGGTITWEDDSTGAPGSGDDVFINGGAITHPDFDDSALDIIWTIVDSTNAVPSFARAAAIGSDPALSANNVTIGTTGIVAEGSTANTIETLLTFEDPTASDKTWTIPNATDTAVGKTTTDAFQNKDLTHASNTLPVEIGLACSDETTSLTTGAAKITFRAPFAFTLTAVRANVNTAPVGSTIIVGINEAGGSVLSTDLTIDASEETSTTAATPAVISDSAIADDAEITIDIDQVGSGTPGKGLKIWLIGTR